ncbi:acyl-CoA/acyl-ACP dehydrogenase [Halopseudomonas nanhaiensis]|uniref:acyl-CoA dehydrogenase family protein n=1 Tax=Halopseudomonas nanhaiensis TaxID=2830842 RepID=UPI001CC1AF42|nr:acyl-CoA dehydrogenase family protein [Halopseudomonas nanhaiensis]UAW98370.1 acyl-CoA/acyl-ACP dehydrogenase [Halopseudomonas nanhaiensis]
MPNLTPKLNALRSLTETIVAETVAPHAERIDRNGVWPAESMQALAEAGLLGLQVPQAQGGHGQGMLALSVITEALGKACPSSALCFGMHCVGTAVIAAKATSHQQEHYLRAIARGEHVTTLALSERGTGSHFYLPETTLDDAGDTYRLNGTKQFVTSGGHADSYVVSTVASDKADNGDFSCVIVDAQASGVRWGDAWNGFGMRGNSSRPLHLENVCVPKANLLGESGDQVWYVFEVVAPYFLMAMAGSYLGVAQSALDTAGEHLRARRYEHSGESLRHIETLQVRFADMWTSLARTRALVREAARMGDAGHPEALPHVLACKTAAGETAVQLANEAMTLCGGTAYRDNSRVAQMLRDARASHVMAPTTDLLKIWTGRSLLGLPLL